MEDFKSVFQKAKNKELAELISIRDPKAFKKSIKDLKKHGLTLEEKRALVLAKTRASLQLRRKNLSPKEVKEFTQISKMRIGKVTKK